MMALRQTALGLHLNKKKNSKLKEELQLEERYKYALDKGQIQNINSLHFKFLNQHQVLCQFLVTVRHLVCNLFRGTCKVANKLVRS